MKNIVKVLVIATFLPFISSIEPMGRGIALIGDKISKAMAPKLSRVLVKELKRLNQETKAKTDFAFGEKRSAENFCEEIKDQAKKGIDPSNAQLSELYRRIKDSNHGTLNLTGADGHTLLYYVFKNNPGLRGYKGILKHLKDRGAQLNARDKYELEPEKALKAMLNVPLNASAWATIKAFRTLVTKNIPEKIQQRIRLGKMSGAQAELRQKTVDEAKSLYNTIESDLLAQRKIEKLQAKKEEYFRFNELI